MTPPPFRSDRDVMTYDALIVGGGPAGLSCAIRLKQRAQAAGRDLSVCLLEKGSAVGAHLLSGAVFEPRALAELFPDYKERGAPLHTPAVSDSFYYLTKTGAMRLPTPPQMHNHGNYIISLGELGTWLASQAEALGVEIYPGFAAAELLRDDQGRVVGVATGDMGLAKDGSKTESFTPGVEIHARQTILAEGCHGSLTQQVIAVYHLRTDKSPQTYALGVKEIWEIAPEKSSPGHILHTIGWPMDCQTYGGGWLYHLSDNKVSVGFVTGLDYQNPYLSPFEEMQRLKTHPLIAATLTGGRRLAYGARALVEGGLTSQPKLTFPGGVLIGDAAGFLNVPKIKGNHTAMKSGLLAADAVFDFLMADTQGECTAYPAAFRASWAYDELYRARNIRAGFRWGLIPGLIHAAFQTMGGWRLPYTLSHHADHTALRLAKDTPEILYPKPDGVLTFDRLSSVYLSGTHHAEGQPCHLRLKDPAVPTAHNLPLYAEPATRYCPAGVYEIVTDQNGAPTFQINAQNCLHCKTCDIKDPSQNITWTVPEGSGGPNYTGL